MPRAGGRRVNGMKLVGRDVQRSFVVTGAAIVSLTATAVVGLAAQETAPPAPPEPPRREGPPQFGPGGPPMGRGGPGGMMRQERKLVKEFDLDGNGWLNREERQAARELVRREAASRPARGGFGGPGGAR